MSKPSLPSLPALKRPTLRRPALPKRPATPDLVLAAGAACVGAALLMLLASPVTTSLRRASMAAAVRGNAATLQLAVESWAAAHLGAYPDNAAVVLPLLPHDRAPANPVTGRPVTFAAQPGDLTYRRTADGRGYVIEAWDPARAAPTVLMRLEGRQAPVAQARF
ncbi:MAG TPA: hypothetical protein PLQ13_13575 [Candidatus Krumholzibacteria bacterium]|nr:hypothetical protein [Candidatus Krumholzibacteria bacterium]